MRMPTIGTSQPKTTPIVMPVEVQRAEVDEDLPSDEQIAAWADAVIESARPGSEDGDVCIRLVGTQEGRNLNNAYRGIDKVTNVLSFCAETGLPEEAGKELHLLGDIAICAEVVREDAPERCP